MRQTSHDKTWRAMRQALIGGTLVTGGLTLGVGGWAATTQLAGAVIAPGALVVDKSVKKVQHPTGGIIDELNVRDGSTVHEGDVLIRLDETVTGANLAVVTKNMDELSVRQARLKAEQDGRDRVAFPPDMLSRKAPNDIEMIAEETRLFDLRRTARNGQKAQLKERIAQLAEQIQGMEGQIKAKAREIVLIGQELNGVRELWQKNLVQITRVTALERDAARLEGEHGALISARAQVRGRITETELQILQIDQDLRSDVSKELADIRGKMSELSERRITAQDQLKRIDIRAPINGVVHQLAAHTVGGVIGAGETLMVIVPGDDALTVEARIAPQDIDQVRIGQKALLRFSAFNQRTTPEIAAEVSLVSADISQDQRSGASYYTVRITPTTTKVAQLDGLKLVPGMPVEGFIQTGDRTVISYLTKPLSDQFFRTWREK